MDPVTTVTTGAILGLPAAALAHDFIKRVFGPVADEAGRAFASPIKEWNDKRERLAVETVESAALMLDAVGHAASPVPGRVLFPLLQAASVEEDADLRRMWSTLLANSADVTRAADMMPAFVSLLKELSPIEARVLEAVYLELKDGHPRIGYAPDAADANATGRVNFASIRLYAGNDLSSMTEVTLPFKDFRVLADNLARLGLVEQAYSPPTWGATSTTRIYGALELTPLGVQFVGACVVGPTADAG